MALAGVSFSSMRLYAFYVGRLVDPSIEPRLLKSAMIKSAMSPTLHTIAVLLAFVDTRLTIALYVLLPMLFFLPSQLERHARSRTV
jgi:hypothetical protein